MTGRVGAPDGSLKIKMMNRCNLRTIEEPIYNLAKRVNEKGDARYRRRESHSALNRRLWKEEKKLFPQKTRPELRARE